MGCKLRKTTDECQFIAGQPYRTQSLPAFWLLVLPLVLLSSLGAVQEGKTKGSPGGQVGFEHV